MDPTDSNSLELDGFEFEVEALDLADFLDVEFSLRRATLPDLILRKQIDHMARTNMYYLCTNILSGDRAWS